MRLAWLAAESTLNCTLELILCTISADAGDIIKNIPTNNAFLIMLTNVSRFIYTIK